MWVLLLALLPGLLQAQQDSSHHQMGDDDPPGITEEVNYDPESGQYVVVKKVGDIEISSEYLSPEEYRSREMARQTLDYWRKKAGEQAKGDESNSLIPQINLGDIPGGLAHQEYRPN